MQKVETTTTDFKRALKTVTDILTDSEKKKYDVGIEIHYQGNTGRIVMSHPENEMVVSADFQGEDYDGTVDILFFIEDLSEVLKKYRRKEPLYIDRGMGAVMFSTEEGIIFEGALVDDRIVKPKTTNMYRCNRENFINVLEVGQGVTKTTFHNSSMALQFVGLKNSLHVKATNLAQMSFSELMVEDVIKNPIQATLSAKEITKVRNTIQRGRSEDVTFGKSGKYFVIQTDITSIAFVDKDDIQHINANRVMKNLHWEDDVYHLNVRDNEEIVKEQYDALLQAEKEKDKEGIEKSQVVYLTLNKKSNEMKFSREPKGVQVDTRDMNSILSKLPDILEAQVNDNAILLSHADELIKTKYLLPVMKVNEESG